MDVSFGLIPLTQEERNKIPIKSVNLIETQRGIDRFDPAQPDKYYVYTGRGPSKGQFHLGHLPGLQVARELQEFLGTKTEFMISDDEKIFRDGFEATEMEKNVSSTLVQLRALGFTEETTNFRINSRGICEKEYALVIQMMKMVNVNTLSNIFGEKENLGEYFYPIIQLLPCFKDKSKQCIVVAGLDQDPFFRLARDLAKRLGYLPPIVIYVKSVPGLDGSEKMSTSVESSLPIFLGETQEEIDKKISKIKKVGAGSLEELFLKGADLSIDIPYRLLLLFDTNLENLELIRKAYTQGLFDADEISRLNQIIPEKGVKEDAGKYMLTSFGIRKYLAGVLSKIVRV